jgi:hypothetical protein
MRSGLRDPFPTDWPDRSSGTFPLIKAFLRSSARPTLLVPSWIQAQSASLTAGSFVFPGGTEPTNTDAETIAKQHVVQPRMASIHFVTAHQTWLHGPSPVYQVNLLTSNAPEHVTLIAPPHPFTISSATATNTASVNILDEHQCFAVP